MLWVCVGMTTPRRRKGPVGDALTAWVACDSRDQHCIPQWAAISLTKRCHCLPSNTGGPPPQLEWFSASGLPAP